MRVKFFQFNRVRLLSLVMVSLLICFIPVRIAVTFRQAPVPQGIFVLGGAAERMEFAGKFWQSRRDLDIWVSDFDWNLDVNRRIFAKFGVPEYQLHLLIQV